MLVLLTSLHQMSTTVRVQCALKVPMLPKVIAQEYAR